MLAQGLDPSHSADRKQFGLTVINDFKREMTAFIRQRNLRTRAHLSAKQRPGAILYGQATTGVNRVVEGNYRGWIH